jgi:hypothetical protein
LLTSGELGWSGLLKFFLNLIHMIFASLLGTTWKGINMIGMMNECTQARRPKTRACTGYWVTAAKIARPEVPVRTGGSSAPGRKFRREGPELPAVRKQRQFLTRSEAMAKRTALPRHPKHDLVEERHLEDFYHSFA